MKNICEKLRDLRKNWDFSILLEVHPFPEEWTPLLFHPDSSHCWLPLDELIRWPILDGFFHHEPMLWQSRKKPVEGPHRGRQHDLHQDLLAFSGPASRSGGFDV